MIIEMIMITTIDVIMTIVDITIILKVTIIMTCICLHDIENFKIEITVFAQVQIIVQNPLNSL